MLTVLSDVRGDRALDHVSIREADTPPLHLVAAAEPAAHEDITSVARACLEDMKAEETVEIDLVGRTSIADTMIITSGRSNRHVGSIAERMVQAFKDHGFGRVRVEGFPACDWVLIDAGDIIVHIFRPEVRGFYNLENMWAADRPSELAAG